ncbi:hypothetical protein [Streptomyces canus]|uniref:hypothetical protein n=1 Tax=Streptomyces canus TaxID=58343 RepID=UPI0038B640A7
MTSVLYPGPARERADRLIGAPGASKSTLARTCPASQVLSLDDLRSVVGDDFPVTTCVAPVHPAWAMAENQLGVLGLMPGAARLAPDVGVRF